MVTGASSDLAGALRARLANVTDPEIPVLTIEDLGILRDVKVHAGGRVEVIITPTYSGCPALHQLEQDIVAEMAAAGYADVTVTTALSPAWTTDWMTGEGRRKLQEYGIAPPVGSAPSGPVSLSLSSRPPVNVRCPRCGEAARETSRFGSTACKAAYVCTSCQEPFDYFKAI
jgi:ring-1,2-phenylacetyl-CoA epoxidase subunit PaaD